MDQQNFLEQEMTETPDCSRRRRCGRRPTSVVAINNADLFRWSELFFSIFGDLGKRQAIP